LDVLIGHFFFDRYSAEGGDGGSPRNLFKFSKMEGRKSNDVPV
jgi:hypothetical protein